MHRGWLIALSCGACAGHAASVQTDVAEGQRVEAGIDDAGRIVRLSHAVTQGACDSDSCGALGTRFLRG